MKKKKVRRLFQKLVFLKTKLNATTPTKSKHTPQISALNVKYTNKCDHSNAIASISRVNAFVSNIYKLENDNNNKKNTDWREYDCYSRRNNKREREREKKELKAFTMKQIKEAN